MRAIHNLLVSELESLESYIVNQEKISKFIRDAKRKDEELEFEEFNNAKRKIYNYNSYVITVYGLFERYIENILMKFLSDLSKSAKNYNSLPKSIKESLVKKNAELLLSLTLNKNKNLDPKDLVAILNKNLSENGSDINPYAFTQHTSNFRHNTISDFFKNVGIISVSNKIRKYSPLKEVLEKDYSNIDGQKSSRLFAIIDDIADRRNDIAHGVENIEILHPSIIITYIQFIKAYSVSLFKVLENELLEFKYSNQSRPIEKIGVLKNEVLLCELKDIELDYTSKLIAKRNGQFPEYLECSIKEIQLNGKKIENVAREQELKVGIQLNQNISVRNKFKIVI